MIAEFLITIAMCSKVYCSLSLVLSIVNVLFSCLQRFGVALVPWGQMDLKRKEFSDDFQAIDGHCSCVACKNCTRAYIHSLIVQKETVACNLLSLHNVSYMVRYYREEECTQYVAMVT